MEIAINFYTCFQFNIKVCKITILFYWEKERKKFIEHLWKTIHKLTEKHINKT